MTHPSLVAGRAAACPWALGASHASERLSSLGLSSREQLRSLGADREAGIAIELTEARLAQGVQAIGRWVVGVRGESGDILVLAGNRQLATRMDWRMTGCCKRLG